LGKGTETFALRFASATVLHAPSLGPVRHTGKEALNETTDPKKVPETLEYAVRECLAVRL